MKTPHTLFPTLARRRLLLAGGAATLLAACGGGGDDAGEPQDPGAPRIIEFTADRGTYMVGDKVTLRVRFEGASARIEPGVGAVANGAVAEIAAIDGPRLLRLTVQSPGQPAATRELWLDVRFRDRWVALAAPRMSYHAAVTAGDGSVVVIGGSRGEGVLSSAVERFDPATRGFTRIGTLATGRSNHSAVRLPDGRILVAGGVTSSPDAPFAELVDEVSGVVTHAGRMVQPRTRHTATLLGDGRVLVTGGSGRNSAEVWNPATGAWRLLTSRLAHDREHHTATLLADGRVLVVGGRSDAFDYVFAEVFDPATDSFTPVDTGITQQRQLHAAHRLSDGSVVLIGGEDPTVGTVPISSVLRCFPLDDGGFATFAQPPLTVARTLAASIVFPEDRVMLIGGETPDEQPSARPVLWQTAGAQRSLAAMPAGRLWASANRLSDGRILVLGGDDGAGRYVDGALIYE